MPPSAGAPASVPALPDRKGSAGNRFTVRRVVREDDPRSAADLLRRHTGLSRRKIKEAMAKGAAWRSGKGRGRTRIRKASAALSPGQEVSLFYDEAILALKPPEGRCVADEKRFSVWDKPAGLLTQGTDHGDHCSLQRQVEVFFTPRRPAFLLHRLDREAAGLVIFAHDRRAAARLSALFRNRRMHKRYRAAVRGNPGGPGAEAVIRRDLDGKPAETAYKVVRYDPEADMAWVDVRLGTGRLHQIRRHFDGIGHPVMGDPRYGTGNKNREGMRLFAVALAFRCPFSGRDLLFSTSSVEG